MSSYGIIRLCALIRIKGSWQNVFSKCEGYEEIILIYIKLIAFYVIIDYYNNL